LVSTSLGKAAFKPFPKVVETKLKIAFLFSSSSIYLKAEEE